MRFAKNLLERPVYILNDMTRVGSVYNFILDPKTKKIIAFEITGSKKQKDKRLIAISDLLGIATDGILIENKTKISTRDDYPKGYKILEENGLILEAKAKGIGKRKILGQAKDFTYDDEWNIKGLYIQKKWNLNPLRMEKVIEAENIKSFEKNTIFIKD